MSLFRHEALHRYQSDDVSFLVFVCHSVLTALFVVTVFQGQTLLFTDHHDIAVMLPR